MGCSVKCSRSSEKGSLLIAEIDRNFFVVGIFHFQKFFPLPQRFLNKETIYHIHTHIRIYTFILYTYINICTLLNFTYICDICDLERLLFFLFLLFGYL